MSYKIIDEFLVEGKLFNHSTKLKSLNVNQAAELALLFILSLQVMKNEFSSKAYAIEYIWNTFKRPSFDTIYSYDSDLYWLLFGLIHKNSNYFKNHSSNDIELKRIKLNLNNLIKWAKNSVKGIDEFDKKFLMSLEQELDIDMSDYKSLRRLVSSWQELTYQQKQVAATRLLFALQKKAPRAELTKVFSNFSHNNDFMIKDAVNPEQKGPDTSEGILKKLAVGAAVAGGAYLLTRWLSNSKKEKLKEEMSATTAGTIASIAMPMGGYAEPLIIRRNQRKKRKK